MTVVYIPPRNDQKHRLTKDFPIMEAVSNEGMLNLKKPVLFSFKDFTYLFLREKACAHLQAGQGEAEGERERGRESQADSALSISQP